MCDSRLSGIPGLIDISCVRTNVALEEVNAVADAARKYRFLAAFSMPCYTEYLVKLLERENDILVGGAVGFPSGADTTETKVFQAKELLKAGADEIDMLINVGRLLSGDDAEVQKDIEAVSAAAGGKPVKCILEVAYLTDEQIRRGVRIVMRTGAAYVKTGTGWAQKPTTVDIIKLIKDVAGDKIKVKAAGGITRLDDLLAMIDAGCDRFGLGLKSALSVMRECEQRQ
jgi:deoxyribose-phosphate aldolase